MKETENAKYVESTKDLKNLQKFTAPIQCELSDNGKTLKLLKGFYYYRDGNKLDVIVVPAGFVSDGYSSSVFEFLIPRFSVGTKCAILHDYLCEAFHAGQCTRKFADSVFLEALLATTKMKFRSRLLYASVRCFAFFKGYK